MIGFLYTILIEDLIFTTKLKMNKKNREDFRALIEKYLNAEINLEEMKRLVNYYESFQQSQEWLDELGSENIVKEKILANIHESIKEETCEIRHVPFYKKSIFKYAIAASIAILFLLSFIFDKDTNLEAKDEVVNYENISVGTDRATLTLEDGSQVDLEKGESFKMKNVKSNGKEIIYEAEETNGSEKVYNYLTIPRGGQFSVKLSDGTHIWLNSESQLKYPVSFISDEPREVELVYGEAYFEVSPSELHSGSRFRVITNQQEVTVIGTAFNIKAYRDEDSVYTTLVEGRINLSRDVETIDLLPSQQAVLTNNSVFEIRTVDVFNEISWKEGIFSFEGKSLKEIMQVLSRWYDVDVEFENEKIKNTKFVGILDKDQSIEEIVENIKEFGDLNSFEIKGKRLILK